MNSIEFGDKVRHKTNNDYNVHPMDVMEVDENKVLCSYFDRIEKTIKEKWFNYSDLELISKTEGGFF
ncbi:hypothetical protein [Cecembia lonarensis]|uniref:Uncharacterized protein n=1 Tax=Cecembia lonarensis (strain CCUG 58316 / KCTC 22772 / LW9) TaxID=1225176 RepID=K1L0A0_CECL9|nr:hypothetical protein [Cecembia lonarensis]EKB48196.1 hypothetical protein B879_03195 [Cecembia lonarensis LW9]